MTTITPQPPSQPARPDDGRSRDPLPAAGQRLADEARQIADAGERAVHAGLDKAYQGASAARRSVEQGLSATAEIGEDWMCTLKKTVEAHPLITIAAAVGVGIVLDRLLGGPRH